LLPSLPFTSLQKISNSLVSKVGPFLVVEVFSIFHGIVGVCWLLVSQDFAFYLKRDILELFAQTNGCKTYPLKRSRK